MVLRGLAIVLALGTALVIVLAVQLVNGGGPPPSESMAAGETSPSTAATAASTTVAPVTTVERASALQARVAAAYLGWFDAIYRGDSEALTAHVATDELRAAGEAAIATGTVRFRVPPTPGSLSIAIDEVLLDRPDCVVVAVTDRVDALLVAEQASRSVITVLWPAADGALRMVSQWAVGTPPAVWRADCDARVRMPRR